MYVYMHDTERSFLTFSKGLDMELEQLDLDDTPISEEELLLCGKAPHQFS